MSSPAPVESACKVFADVVNELQKLGAENAGEIPSVL
jgi:hypothetical protein